MKITLENTMKMVQLNGVPARIWEGQTESGIRVHAFITRLAVPNDQDQSQFEKELQETKAPSAEIAVYPMRMIL
jgi:hypothetical protein